MNEKFSFSDIWKKKYIRYTIIITIIIIILMYLTQSLWINTGTKLLFKEYGEDILQNNSNIPDGIYIISGSYSQISKYVNTTEFKCENNVKFLAYTYKEKNIFNRIIAIKPLEGCN